MTNLKNYNISPYSPAKGWGVSKLNEAKASSSLLANQLNLSRGLVPLFNNPSSKASGSCQPLAGSSLPKATISSSSRLQQLNLFNSKILKNLVFLQKKGSQTSNPNIISYKFPAKGWSNTKYNGLRLVNNISQGPKLITNNVYKLLFKFFKSMYCLISKPVFITTPDKIKIQLFYFLCIPKILINKNLAVAEGLAVGYKASNNKKATLIELKRRNFWPQASKDFGQRLVKLNLKNLAQSNLTKVYPNKFKLICTILSKFFNKPVELELIRLHQPYYDSNILVNFLALIINKKNIGACIHKLYNSNIIKSNKATSFNFWPQASIDNIYNPLINSTAAHLSGLNIKISGRLMREPIIPRITTKKFEKGFTAKGKINYSDVARFTHKNRKGAFTITVKSGQNF